MSVPRTLLLASILFASGCSSSEPLEERIRELSWKLDAAEQAAEQAEVDRRLAQQEVTIEKQRNQELGEKLSLANDGLREARVQIDEGLKERLTELSESTEGGPNLEISKYGGVMIESGILFRPGRHVLTAAGKQALRPLVATLKQKKNDDYDIELTGHTDSDKIKHSRGRYRDNWDLGAMRANSVRAFLVQNGIAQDRIYLSSWGFVRPVGAKHKNRRVEIALHKRVEAVPASAAKR